MHVAAEQALNRGARTAIRYLVELDAGRLLEQHGGEMERIADAGMRDIDLARLPLGLVDQLSHGIDLEPVGIGDQHAQEAGGERHRREILSRVEWEFLVEAGIGGISRDIAEQHGVAVRRRFGDEIGAEIGRRARLVLDHDWLAHELGHFLSDQPREEVGSAARGIRDDQMNRLGWIVLREGALHRSYRADRDDRGQYRRSK